MRATMTMERTFDIHGIAEDEAHIMQALLPQDEEGALAQLQSRSHWWDDRMTEDEAFMMAGRVIGRVGGIVGEEGRSALPEVGEDEIRVMKSLLALGEEQAIDRLESRPSLWEDRVDEDEAYYLAHDVVSMVDKFARERIDLTEQEVALV